MSISECPIPTAPINGAVDTSTGIYEGRIITYSCDNGYRRVGSETATCTIGAWSENPPTCKIGRAFLILSPLILYGLGITIIFYLWVRCKKKWIFEVSK